MTLFFGSAFLAAALLSCLVPISLLICFATFFGRTARRIHPSPAPTAGRPDDPEPTAAERQSPDDQA